MQVLLGKMQLRRLEAVIWMVLEVAGKAMLLGEYTRQHESARPHGLLCSRARIPAVEHTKKHFQCAQLLQAQDQGLASRSQQADRRHAKAPLNELPTCTFMVCMHRSYLGK